MRVIVVDKKKEQVVKASECNTDNIEKYLKIDDFTYSLYEGSDSPTEAQLYYGFDAVISRLSSTDGYVVYVPGHGKFFLELVIILTIVQVQKYKFFKMGQENPLNIPKDTLVIISRRGKLENMQ